MPKQKIPTAKISNIQKLVGLGYSITKVAQLTGVSRVTVMYNTNEDYRKKEITRRCKYKKKKPTETMDVTETSSMPALQASNASIDSKHTEWETE